MLMLCICGALLSDFWCHNIKFNLNLDILNLFPFLCCFSTGNSSETNDSEQYVPESDYQQHSSSPNGKI